MWETGDTTELWTCGGIRVSRRRYHAERYPWGEPYIVDERDAVSLVRYGAYRRRSDGVEHLVDANTGFFRRRGEEVEVANFTGEREEFTLLELDEPTLAELFAEPLLPGGPFQVTPEIDFAHRLLLRSIRSRSDEAMIEESMMRLITSIVSQRRADVVCGSRATTEPNRRTLVTDACEVLHLTHGNVSLQELARRVGSSPFHLSRVFRAYKGSTISQYRLRLRVHEVLDRLSEGEADLSALANVVGFSDHSHMTRTVVAQLGVAPSTLRRRLREQA